jgi:hypothetical protein
LSPVWPRGETEFLMFGLAAISLFPHQETITFFTIVPTAYR